MSEEVKDAVQVIAEYVDMTEVEAFLSLHKELELLTTKTELAASRVDNAKLQLRIKYNMGEADSFDIKTGKITRNGK